jgi:hypothetical protein
MKFTGMHLHLILVAAVICVVLYVFYISRDIVQIDKEVKALHAKIDQIAKVGISRGFTPAVPTSMPPSQSSTPYPPSQPPIALSSPAAAQPLATTPVPATSGGSQLQLQQRSRVATSSDARNPTPMPATRLNAPKSNPPQRPDVQYSDDDEDDDDVEDLVSDADDDDAPSSIDVQAQVSKLSSITEDESSDSDDTDEKLQELLDAVNADVERSETPSNQQEDGFDKLSWNEIKERCKKLNIPIRGSTKDQLIQKLKQASSSSST